MSLDWTMTATCASAVIAILALIYSVHQTRLSNKQSLFDRRLSVWLTTLGLLSLYGENRDRLEKGDEPQLALDLIFAWLTNNSFLCDAGQAAFHPLEAEYQRPLLIKLEEMNGLSHEAKYVFKGAAAEAISCFIADYRF